MANRINIFKHFSILFVLLFTSLSVLAYEPQEKDYKSQATSTAKPKHDEEGNEKFNAGKLIIEHISDSHDWHIAGHLSVPLPIIIYDTEKGFDVFLSSRFEHGTKGYHGYRLEGNHIIPHNEVANEELEAFGIEPSDEIVQSKNDTNRDIYDLSITKNVMSIFITFGLMLWIFISVAKVYSRNPGSAPKGMQSLVEPLIIFVRDDIAKSAIGEKKHKKYLPFLLTVFFFIWISNLLGLIPILPGGANVTGNIAIGMVLAAIVFVITLVTANKHYWRHIFAMPGVPVGVLVLLTPIEIFGMFLKPFVLMIRLFANMLAGHIIALSFFSLIFIFAEMSTGLGWGVGVFSVAFTIFMGMLELLVAFLQAYVFTLLAAMYFGSAIDEGHDKHNPHDDHDHSRNF